MKPRYLFPKDYMADPSVHVFNNTLYIYPSHDRDTDVPFDDDGGHFQMRDYHVLSVDGDVMTGPVTDHGCILDVDNVAWAEKQMWDNDVIEKDGLYYLIFSAKDYNGVFHLGVAVGERPEGPFIAQPQPISGSYSIDPCVFKDDDGKAYCYFGGLWGGQLERYGHAIGTQALPSRVARMSNDMLQFDEKPRHVVIVDDNGEPLMADNPHRFFEASWMHKKDGIYYFSYSTGDSHLLCYATGYSPYDPFTYRGVLLQPVVGWTTHHSIVEYRGEWFLFYHDCVPSGGITHLRSLKVQRLFYNPDGTIKPVCNDIP